MRRLPPVTLFLLAAGLLSAQENIGPPFRLKPEAVAAAAQRIDSAALALERTLWDRRMTRTPVPERTPFVLPPVTDDATFLRRASLDLQARLPTAERMRTFLQDTDPAKRTKLVDRLLLEPASGARRFIRLADMLRVKDEVLAVSLRPFVDWLQDACARSMPYDELVRAMLTASGEVNANPATGWLLRDGGRMTVAATGAMRAFLDEDISCARCHDHPYTDWTQMQYYQIAACFNSTQVVRLSAQGRTVLWPTQLWNEPELQPLAAGERLVLMDVRGSEPLRLPPCYKYKDGKTGDPVKPLLPSWRGADLEQRPAALAKVKDENLRAAFAEWMVNNRRFALVAALRTWHDLFGVPVQDAGNVDQRDYHLSMLPQQFTFRCGKGCERIGSRNLPSWQSGEILVGPFIDRQNDLGQLRLGEVLAQEFLRARQDLREFERILGHTEAFQRESIVMELGAPSQFRAPVLRRLRPETIWNNLARVQTDGATGAGLLSHELPQVPAEDHPSRVLGRGPREWGDDSLPLIGHDLARFMMNGDVTRLVSSSDSALVRRLSTTQPADLAVEEAFLAVLGRFPTHSEKLKAMEYGIANPATVWSDLVWSLLNTSEFIFQH